MSLYAITKNLATGKWHITHQAPGWITPLGTFAKRKEAITVARLLAGRNGKVVLK